MALESKNSDMLSRLDWLGHYIVLFISKQAEVVHPLNFEASGITFPFIYRIRIRSEWSAYREMCGSGSMLFWLFPCRSRKVLRPSYFYSSPVWLQFIFLSIYITMFITGARVSPADNRYSHTVIMWTIILSPCWSVCWSV